VAAEAVNCCFYICKASIYIKLMTTPHNAIDYLNENPSENIQVSVNGVLKRVNIES